MERDWVVDLAADISRSEVVAERIAARGADDVLVEDVGGAWIGIRKNDAFGG